jgi:hypothetical protein
MYKIDAILFFVALKSRRYSTEYCRREGDWSYRDDLADKLRSTVLSRGSVSDNKMLRAFLKISYKHGLNPLPLCRSAFPEYSWSFNGTHQPPFVTASLDRDESVDIIKWEV